MHIQTKTGSSHFLWGSPQRTTDPVIFSPETRFLSAPLSDQLCSENTESKRTMALTSRWGRRAGEAHEGLAFLQLWDKELPGFRRWLVFSEHASQQLHGQFTPTENAQNPPRVTTNSAVFWNIPVADSSQKHLCNFTEQVSVHRQTLFHCTSLFCASQTFWVFVLFCLIQTEGLWQPASSKSIDNFPPTFVHFVPLCHILVILPMFQTFSLLFYLFSVSTDH